MTSLMQQAIRYSDKYGPWLYYIAFFLFLVRGNQLYPFFEFDCWRWVNYAGVILCLSRLLLLYPRYPRYALFCIGISVLMQILVKTGCNVEFFKTILLVSCARDTKIKNSLFLLIIFHLLQISAAFILYNLGITSDIKEHWGTWTGHSYGLSNPNLLAISLSTITHCWIMFKKITNFWHLTILCWSMALAIELITLGTTCSICLFLLPPIYYIVKYEVWRIKISPWTFSLLPLTGILISIILSYIVGPEEHGSSFLSRFCMPYLIYQQYGLNWFGMADILSPQLPSPDNPDPLFIDNLYLSIFLGNGIIAGSIFLVFFLFVLYNIGKNKNPMLHAITLCFLLIAFMEIYADNVYYNITFLYIWEHLNDKTKETADTNPDCHCNSTLCQTV